MRILTKQASMKLTLFLAIVIANILKHHSLSHATEGPRTLLWVGEGQFGQRKGSSWSGTLGLCSSHFQRYGKAFLLKNVENCFRSKPIVSKDLIGYFTSVSSLRAWTGRYIVTCLFVCCWIRFCWRWSLPRHDLSVSQSSGCRSLRRLADTFQQAIWIKHPKACNLSTVSTEAGYLRFSSLFFCVSSMMCTFEPASQFGWRGYQVASHHFIAWCTAQWHGKRFGHRIVKGHWQFGFAGQLEIDPSRLCWWPSDISYFRVRVGIRSIKPNGMCRGQGSQIQDGAVVTGCRWRCNRLMCVGVTGLQI